MSDYTDAGVPLIFVRNVRSEVFADEHTRYVSHEKAAELSAHEAVGGDLLITKMGDPPGDACVYPETAPAAVITADCIRLRISPLLTDVRRFVVYGLTSGIGRAEMRRITSGVAHQKVSLSRFAGIALPLPPLAEQIKIVHELQRRLTAADRLTTTLNRQLERACDTRQSLLREAFTGKLVPQDPTEEAASALLGRIRAAREAEAKKPKAKRMPKPRQKSVDTLEELEELIQRLGNGATPERILHAAGLGGDVEKFFDLLRAGRDKGSLLVPIGNETGAVRVHHAR